MLKRQKVQGPYGRPSSMKRLRTLTIKSKCFTFESYLYFMSLNYLKAPLNLFQPFFLSPVIKLHMTIQMTFKVWVESTYFFLYGIQIRAIWIMICRMFLVCRTPIVIDFHIFSCIFLQFSRQRLCRLSFGSYWHCEWNNNAFNEPFLDYEKDELIIVTSSGTKKQKWNCQKGWKITPSLLTYNKWLIF